MLLETYRLEVFNSRCNPEAMAVHCFAHPGYRRGPPILECSFSRI
jgi:hypothetical protein